MASTLQYYGTGRRKEAVARVYLRPGSGEIKVNDHPFDEYFPNKVLKMIIRQPLALTETADKFDIGVTVMGGGPAGQAGAIRHGISRALIVYNAELRPRLKKEGLPHPRLAGQGAQEVRAEGRASPVPVLETLILFLERPFRSFRGFEGGVIWLLFR